MRIKKTILTCVLGTAATIALTACSSLDTSVPYGSINDTTYASSASGYKVTQKQVYNSMRSKGYSYVTKQIKEFILAEDIKAIDYSNKETKLKINKLIVSSMLSTTDEKAIKEAKADKKTYKITIAKYLDTLAAEGIAITSDNLDFNFTDAGEIDATFPASLVEKFKFNIAYENYGIKNLTEDSKKEKDEEGEKNSFYIAEKDVIKTYDTYKKYAQYSAIVVSFSSLRDAKAASQKAGTLTESNVLDYYVNLYNTRYTFKDSNLTVSDVNAGSDETTFNYNSKENDLTTISANLNTAFDNFKDGEYTQTPINLGNKYFMFYRIKTEYNINKDYGFSQTNEEIDYKDLGDKQTEVYNMLRTKLVENSLSSSYTDTKLAEAFDISKDIKIYDSLYQYKFKSENDDYEYTKSKEFNNDLIFKLDLNGKTYEYSVMDLYNELNPIYGITASTDYLKAEYLLNNKRLTDLLKDDVVEAYTDELKADIKSFKKNNQAETGYSKDMGLENYLLAKYGFTTKDDVLKYYHKANKLNSIYATQYNYTLKDKNFDNSADSLFTIFAKYTKNIQDNYFSCDIDHILIGVDQNYDGTLDNPYLFTESLSATELKKYNDALLALSKAIIAECKTITADTVKAFSYIVKAFELGKPLSAAGYEGKTWDDFKVFNFSLTTESLGSVDSSSASKYVETFSKAVKNIYNYLVEEEFDFEENEGYLQFSAENDALTSVDDLAITTYGYHMLYVNELTDNTSCKFTAESDSKLDSDDEYKSYQHKSILIIDNEEDEDDVYAYADCYSETTYASAQQLFIYFFEFQTSDGVTTFNNTLETAISKVFDNLITRYNSSDFQQYRLLMELGTVTFTDTAYANKYQTLLDIKQRTIDGYNADSEFFAFDGWFSDNWKL